MTAADLTVGPGPAAVRRWVPGLAWMANYQRRWLRGDLAAGAVVAALAVPQSLGYATIAGLPIQVGLYSMPMVLLAYALLGTSRQLIVGPVSTVAVLTGTLITRFNPADEAQAMAYGAAMALGCGALLVVASLLRLGWVAEFLSKPIVTGFVLGLTVLVVIGELPSLLGIPVPPGDVASRIHDLFVGLNEAHAATALVGVAALTIMFAGSHFAPRVPWALVTLVLGLLASAWLQLEQWGVRVVGDVPRGLPTPGLPSVPWAALPSLAFAGAALAVVGLAEGLSAARLFAARSGDRIDANQDLLAFGVSNISSGVFGGFGVAGSLSKTAASDRAGGRTQVTGLVVAVLAICTILVLAPLLSGLPKAVLSAIVIHAVWGLIDLTSLRRYRMLRRNDFVAACAAALGVLVLGPLQGLAVAVGLSVLGLVYRSSRVDVEVMGRVPGEKAAWGSIRNHPERHTVEGILVLRVDVPVFWVNAAMIHDEILSHVDAAPGVVAVIVDLEGTNQLDTTSADVLLSLLAELRRRGVDLYLVRVMFPVRVLLRHSGLVAQLGEDHLWHSISQGVREARIHHGLKDGVADVAGGYDSPAEEHDERIVPRSFEEPEGRAAAVSASASGSPPQHSPAPGPGQVPQPRSADQAGPDKGEVGQHRPGRVA